MLNLKDLTVRIAGKTLIADATAAVPAGAHVGLVGRNGAGKSTLFKVITGELAAETGEATLPARARIGAVAQEAPSGPQSLLETVLAADTERASLLHEAETATDPARIGEIHARLADIEAHTAPARAARILAGLGFDERAQGRPCAEFSGGWRMRVALAAVLFARPDLLMLDEPTNYLDLEGTLWLTDYLVSFPGTALVISHDRDLLDALDHILHLSGTKLTLYAGGFSSFERQRREKAALDAKAKKKQDTQRAHLTAFVERFRAKASKARQAQSRLKALARLEPIGDTVSEQVRPIRFPEPLRKLSPPILAFDKVAVGYGDTPVLHKLSLRIDPDDRIALIGPNGNGKSTFAKLVAGRLAPLGGQMTRADKLGVGYFAQHQVDELVLDDTPYQHLRRLMPDAPEAKVRTVVAGFGFSGEAADTPVTALSGGEKARLMLGLSTRHQPNLLILDEPTNHLDIDARSSLIEAINGFEGAVILVSHDRHLIDACAERLWLVEGGTVEPYDGDLDDYRRRVLARGDTTSRDDDKAPTRTDQRREKAERRAEFAPLRKKIELAEAEMAKLQADIDHLDRWLAQDGIFTREPDKAKKALELRGQRAAALASAEEAWLEASAAYEAGLGA